MKGKSLESKYLINDFCILFTKTQRRVGAGFFSNTYGFWIALFGFALHVHICRRWGHWKPTNKMTGDGNQIYTLVHRPWP